LYKRIVFRWLTIRRVHRCRFELIYNNIMTKNYIRCWFNSNIHLGTDIIIISCGNAQKTDDGAPSNGPLPFVSPTRARGSGTTMIILCAGNFVRRVSAVRCSRSILYYYDTRRVPTYVKDLRFNCDAPLHTTADEKSDTRWFFTVTRL